jgi:alkyl hydroperoxide reductase subunit AhpF
MTPQDEQLIVDWNTRQETPASLSLAGDDGVNGEALAQFCDRLQSLAPIVEKRPAPDDPFRSPAIIVGRHANIAFQAVPEGRELVSFLSTLENESREGSEPPQRPAAQCERIELPADLSLFITMQCPHCPKAVVDLAAIADAVPHLRLTVIDGMRFTETAETHDIRSVPTLILDDQIRWTGQIKVAEVIAQCIDRDPSRLSAASLRQIIESGEAARASAMMIAHGKLFPALVDLLASQRWSVRLGAMVTVEYLADEAPELAENLVAPLWDRFGALDESAQGDVAQVLAQIGSEAARECLNRIVSGDYPASVVEAAREELDG